MTQLAHMVRRRRAQRRLTQRQAADRAGISLSTWQTLERESVSPDSFQDLTLAGVADSLGVPLQTVYKWAGRSGPAIRDLPDNDDSSAPAGDTLEDQLRHLTDLLTTLANHSEMDYLLAYGQAIELVDHLLVHHLDREQHPAAEQ